MYPSDSTPPPVAPGWIALAQLSRAADGPAVFGDGTHATTRLCAATLDLLCRQRRPEAVLDVGTGTGVLARIARARGVRFVVGTDIDPAALDSARAHAGLDQATVEIQFIAEPPDHWGARFDLVVANILEEPLRLLAPALRRALQPGAVLLLSGFTRLQIPALRVVYERQGLTFGSASRLDEWVVVACSVSR